MLSAHTAVGTSFSRQDSQDGPFSAEGESSPKGSAVFAATTALQMQLTASVGNLETLEYGEASQASQNSGGDAADPCSHGEPPSDEDMEENSASVLNGAIAALAGSGAAIFEGKSDNGPGGSAAPSGAQDVRSGAASGGNGAGNQDHGGAEKAESGAADLEGKGWERETEAQDKVMSDARPEDDGTHPEAKSGAANSVRIRTRVRIRIRGRIRARIRVRLT